MAHQLLVQLQYCNVWIVYGRVNPVVETTYTRLHQLGCRQHHLHVENHHLLQILLKNLLLHVSVNPLHFQKNVLFLGVEIVVRNTLVHDILFILFKKNSFEFAFIINELFILLFCLLKLLMKLLKIPFSLHRTIPKGNKLERVFSDIFLDDVKLIKLKKILLFYLFLLARSNFCLILTSLLRKYLLLFASVYLLEWLRWFFQKIFNSWVLWMLIYNGCVRSWELCDKWFFYLPDFRVWKIILWK